MLRAPGDGWPMCHVMLRHPSESVHRPQGLWVWSSESGPMTLPDSSRFLHLLGCLVAGKRMNVG